MLALLVCLLAGAYAAPNLVIIMVDDLGYGDLPIFNPLYPPNNQDPALHPRQRKDLPNIDCLVHNGMKFTDFHTAATLCTPSRAAMMTGRLPWRGKMAHTIFEVFTSASQLGGFPEDEVTLPEALVKHSESAQWLKPYKTGMVGKWHLGVNDADIHRYPVRGPKGEPWSFNYTITDPNRLDGSFLPQSQGFQYSELIDTLGNFGSCAPQRDGEELDDYNFRIESYCFLMGKDDAGAPHVTQRPKKIEDLPQRMVKHFDTFLNTMVNPTTPGDNVPNPYFWYHAFTQIHTPYTASSDFAGTNAQGINDMLEEMDYGVGLLMDRIRQHDEMYQTSTVVIFTSDNGAFYEDYYGTTHDKVALGQTSSLPYKGGKGVMYEGGSRVPTIAWSNNPLLVAPGTTNDHLFSMMDLFPTFMKLARFDPPPRAAPGPLHPGYPDDVVVNNYKPVDGFDISRHLLNPHLESPWHNRFLPYYCGQELQAGRFNNFKYIWTQQMFVDASDYVSGELIDGDRGGESGEDLLPDLPPSEPLPSPPWYRPGRTVATECDGGSCCPVPAGATGTCSCGNHIGFVGVDGNPVVDKMEGRVTEHARNEPLLFDLSRDPHEDCDLKTNTNPDPVDGSYPTVCANFIYYHETVGLVLPWYDYYQDMFTHYYPKVKGKSSYITPLFLPPYYDEDMQPYCTGETTPSHTCDPEPSPDYTVTFPISGWC